MEFHCHELETHAELNSAQSKLLKNGFNITAMSTLNMNNGLVIHNYDHDYKYEWRENKMLKT